MGRQASGLPFTQLGSHFRAKQRQSHKTNAVALRVHTPSRSYSQDPSPKPEGQGIDLLSPVAVHLSSLNLPHQEQAGAASSMAGPCSPTLAEFRIIVPCQSLEPVPNRGSSPYHPGIPRTYPTPPHPTIPGNPRRLGLSPIANPTTQHKPVSTPLYAHIHMPVTKHAKCVICAPFTRLGISFVICM